MTKVKRDYKSRMFTMIFSEKEELLSLYNAMANRNYEDPELLEINTLENAIYLSMKNDLSFIIDSRLKLYEHQSSYNPNIPLRFLMYLANLYSNITVKENLYGTKLVQIPTPQFVVFYNGIGERPEREILRLSDAYTTRENMVSLELIVEVVNINVGYNESIKAMCKTLSDYTIYVQRIRDYMAIGKSIEEAVDIVIEECIERGILREFLIKNRAEAWAVSIFEYNEEEHMRMEREQHFADGQRVGFINTIKMLYENGMEVEKIAEYLKKSVVEIEKILSE